jgi:hypothetical protein
MFSSGLKNSTPIDTSISEDVRLAMNLFWICDGNKQQMDHFIDNETEAELLFMNYLKLDSIKSGTNSNLNKLF